MSYLQLANFKFGLDTRKSELTSVPGSLEAAVDCAINQGGEIEVRKAFILGVGMGNGSAFFGLQETSIGLVTYNSDGTAITPGLFPLTARLVTDPTTSRPVLTNCLYSTVFQGVDWAVLQWSSGFIGVYYGGVLVTEFTNGIFFFISGSQNASNLANITYLANLIAAQQGFYIGAITNPSGNKFTFQMWSDSGLAYSIVSSVISALGTLTAVLVYSSVPSVPAIAAQASFQVTGGSFTGGAQITSIKINAVEVLNTNGSSPFIFPATTGNLTNDNQIAAANLANLISLAISTPDYTAAANGNLVSIIDNSNQGAADNGYVLQITSAGDMMVDDATFSITGTSATTSIIAGGITVGGTSIINSTVTEGGGGTDVTYAASLATAIRAYSGTSGYTAFALGGTDPTVRISKLVRNSNDTALTLAVVLNAGPGTIGSGTGGGTVVTGALNVNPNSSVLNSSPTGGTTPVLNLIVSGGTAPYSYAWAALGTSFFNINSPNAASTSFTTAVALGTGYRQSTYQCTVTDSSTPVQEVFAYATVHN